MIKMKISLNKLIKVETKTNNKRKIITMKIHFNSTKIHKEIIILTIVRDKIDIYNHKAQERKHH